MNVGAKIERVFAGQLEAHSLGLLEESMENTLTHYFGELSEHTVRKGIQGPDLASDKR